MARARHDTAVTALLAALSFLPMLWTARGQVSADTKTYLTLDPGGLLASATSMWDPSVGAGTVPHQNIGYLFPLGPYYWLLETIGMPDWVAQRLLWALLVFAASYGTYRLLRWLGWTVSASLVSAVAYGFSPYLLSYLARLSAILFPWAALPWMIALAAKAARERSWRRAAEFALVVAVVGSVNATSLLFVGLGPVIWLLCDAASRRVAVRAVAAAGARIGVLSVAVSAWWIAGLRVQGSYGLPILDFTETYATVASASTPPEILRGLGYWFFYGGDALDPWIGPAAAYFNSPTVMFVSFGLAGCALLGLLVPFRGRGSMLLLFGAGMVLSVGAAPLGDSTWYGDWYQRFATETTAGAALRSTPRAAPLLLLALACGLGAGTAAIQRWLAQRSTRTLPRLAPLLPAGAVIVVLANLMPWFTGDATSAALLRPERLPDATTELADHLNDADGPDGRIYAIPGSDFADYRWGGTVDPVLPGLTDRSVLYRELIPQGGPGTADLLNAFERRLSDGWFEPESLPVIAELFAVDTIVVRNDLQYERYRLARPGPLWTDVTAALGSPDHAGPLTRDETRIPLIDEITIARHDAAQQYPITAAFDVNGGADLFLRDATAPMIVAGSGDGLVDLAAAGLLDTSRPVIYAPLVDDDVRAVIETPWWVITDSNRKQGHRWSSLGSNLGVIESAGDLVTDADPRDSRLELFDDELADQTIAVHVGDVADVVASSYGSAIVYIGENAPHFAADGDPLTAWRGAIAAPSAGLDWRIDFEQVEELGHLVLIQPQSGATDRFITRVRVTTDAGSFDVDLTDASRSSEGQRVDLVDAPESTASVSIEVLADSVGDVASHVGQPGVGFAEVSPIRADGSMIVDDRVVRTPIAADRGIAPDDRLSYVLTRERLDPATPNRQAPEPTLDRQFDLPDRRALELTGHARLAGDASDALIETLTSGVDASISAVASTRLPGSVTSRGAAAIDGDLSTAWQTPFDGALGATLTVSTTAPVDSDEMTITWRDDGKHAVPTELTVVDERGDAVIVPVPTVEPNDGIATATLEAPMRSSTEMSITITGVSDDTVPEYFSGTPRRLPVAIADVRFGPAGDDGTDPQASVRSAVDTGCRDDILTLDGLPLAVSVDGPASGVLSVSSCDGPIDLAPGEHRLSAAPGQLTGIDVDRLVLDDPQLEVAPATTPPVTVSSLDATAIDATLPATDDPTWLVLPQSRNVGWTATLDGVDLAESRLINGYANGWLIEAGPEGRRVELRWTPQRQIDIALSISLISGIGLVLLIAVTGWRRRGLPRRAVDQPDAIASSPGIALTRRTQQVLALIIVVGCVVVGGPAAAASAAAVAVVHFTPRFQRWANRVALVLACIGWGAVSAGVIAAEWRFDYADGPDWPLRFTWASSVTWMAVGAVVSASALSVLSAHRRPAHVGTTAG